VSWPRQQQQHITQSVIQYNIKQCQTIFKKERSFSFRVSAVLSGISPAGQAGPVGSSRFMYSRGLVALGLLLDQLPLGVDCEDPTHWNSHLLIGKHILRGDERSIMIS